MNSRMEKYQTGSNNVAVKERTAKNKRLYEEVQDMNIDYIDINVNDAIEIIPEKTLKKTRSDYQMRKEIEKIIPSEKKEFQEPEKVKKEQRVYDINEILKLARNNKLFEDDQKKRLLNTEYNILTKLDIEKINDSEELTKESLKQLIDTIYQNEDNNTKKQDSTKNNFKTNNQTSQQESQSEDLLSDLIADEKEEMIINEEISKKILDRPETTSLNTKEDTTTTELDLTNKEKEKKSAKLKKAKNTDLELDEDENLLDEDAKSKGMLIAIIIIVVLLLAAGGYLFFKYFGTI